MLPSWDTVKDHLAWLLPGSSYAAFPEPARATDHSVVGDVFIRCRGFDFGKDFRCDTWTKYEEGMGFGEHIYFCPEHFSQLLLIEGRRLRADLYRQIDFFVRGSCEHGASGIDQTLQAAFESLTLSSNGSGEHGQSGLDSSLQAVFGLSVSSSAGHGEQDSSDLDPALLSALDSLTVSSAGNSGQDHSDLDPAFLAALDSLTLSTAGSTKPSGSATTATKEASSPAAGPSTLTANKVQSLLEKQPEWDSE